MVLTMFFGEKNDPLTVHYGPEQKKRTKLMIHFPMSSGVSEQESQKMSTAECASEAISAQQANELVVRANEWTDERVAQYMRTDSWMNHCGLD